MSHYITKFRNAVCCVITYRTHVNCAWDHPRMTKKSTIIAGHNTFITQRSLTQCTSRDDKSFSHHSIRYRPVLRVSVNRYTQSKSTLVTTRTASFHSKSFSIFPANLYAFRMSLTIKSNIWCVFIAKINCPLRGVETVPDRLLSKLQTTAVLHTHIILCLTVQKRDAWKHFDKSDALLEIGKHR